MNRENSERSAAIGFAIAAVGLVATMVFAALSHLLRPYGPVVREFLLWLMVPQFAIGMLTMLVAVVVFAMSFLVKDARP